MRKITEQAHSAFMYGGNWKSSNTQVKTDNHTELYLHDNLIAKLCTSVGVFFSLAGWNTPTTRERLQAAGVKVKQKAGAAVFVSAMGSSAPEQVIDDEKVYLVMADDIIPFDSWDDVELYI